MSRVVNVMYTVFIQEVFDSRVVYIKSIRVEINTSAIVVEIGQNPMFSRFSRLVSVDDVEPWLPS